MLENLKEVLKEEQLKELESFIETEKVKAKEGLFGEEELNKKVQSETDRVRTEYTKKVKTLEEELTQLKPKDKSEAEIALEKKLAELEAKEKEIANKERYLKIQDTLQANELPKDLAKYLNVSGDDEIETITQELGSILNQHLMNSSYKPKDRKKNDGMTKEQFKQLSYVERVQLQESNPTLYAKLSN